MKSHALTASVVLAGLVVMGQAVPAGAQTIYRAQPNESSVKIDGESTTHAWEMEGKMVGGTMEFAPGVTLDPSQTSIAGVTDGKVPVKVHALIPVSTIHSKAEHMPEVMDHLMQDALRADNSRVIEYKLSEMTFKGPHTAGTPFNFDTTGDLAIAGVTNKVSFPVTVEVVEPGKIRVDATVPLKMTSYKVDPPAPNIGLGLMKCRDDVKIIIDWTLKVRK